MIRTPLLCAAALVLGAGLAAETHASDATVIRGGQHVVEVKRVEHRIHSNNTRRLVKVVTHEVDDRIVTLNKAIAMSGQDDRHDIIHVEYVHENVYLDPDKDYLRQHEHGSFDARAQIPTAHRLGRDLRANKAQLVFGNPQMVPMHEIEHQARPLMIIEKPDGARRVIPSVPTPPKKRDRALMVMAE